MTRILETVFSMLIPLTCLFGLFHRWLLYYLSSFLIAYDAYFRIRKRKQFFVEFKFEF